MATDPGAYTSQQVVNWAEGSTLLIDMDYWRRVGSWDESCVLYSEATDHGGSAVSTFLWPLLMTNRRRLHLSAMHLGKGGLLGCSGFSSRGLAPVVRRQPRRISSPAESDRLRQAPGPESIAAR